MSRMWPIRVGVHGWVKFFLLVVVSGCGRVESSIEGDGSSLFGTGSFLDELFFGPKPRVPSVMSRSATRLVQVSSEARTTASFLTPKKALRLGIMEAIRQEGAIPPNQLHGLLYDLLEPRSTACGGASCGRVFNVDIQEIDREMDEVLADVQNSPSLADSQHRQLKENLELSLTKPRKISFADNLLGTGQMPRSASSSLEGTCAGGTLLSYGLRSLGAFRSVVGSLNPFKNTIDYRNGMPKKFQGMTGSCHLFATIELLRHHRDPVFKNAKNIQIERTFAEIWAKSLGSSVDEAVENEIKVFGLLQVGQRITLRTYEGQGLPKGEAVQKALQEASFQIRFYPQGGSGLDDFAYLKENGAVLDDGSIRPVPLKELEALGEELALARVGLLRKAGLEGPSAVTPDMIRGAMRPIMAKIFSLADESRGKAGRMVIARELDDYEMVSKRFNSGSMQGSIQDFMESLEKHGPLYVGTERHATLLVAYNSWRKRFFIRDSADELGRPYVELRADEFFNRLRLYYYLVPKKQMQ